MHVTLPLLRFSAPRLCSLALLAIGLFRPFVQAQTHYVYQELGFHPTAINDLGQIAGWRVGGGGYEAVTWSGGVITVLGAGFAYGINNSGQVAGSALISDVYRAGYWQANGAYVAFETGGEYQFGAARAISNGTDGHPLYVVGDFGAPDERGNYAYAGRGFVYTPESGTTILNSVGAYTTTAVNENGTFTAIATQSGQVYGGVGYAPDSGGWSLGQNFMPLGVNDAGIVVGGMVVGGIDHGFSATFGGGVVDLGVGYARAINDLGVIAGFQVYGGSAFVVENGQRYDLISLVDNDNGFTSTADEPKGINNLGQIVGEASNGAGFLLTPVNLVPEPAATAALGAFAALLIAGFRRARRV